MKSFADHWIRINGYLIEVFEGSRGDELIRIDGKPVKEGTTYQQCVQVCTNAPPKALGAQAYYYDEDSPIQREVKYGHS